MKRNFILILSAVMLVLSACSKNNSDDTSSNVPTVSVNLSINVNTSAYSTLSTVGGIAYLTNVGNRGILLYRLSTSTILAFDRTCTYDLPDANGIIVALTNGTAMCQDCNSIYNLYDGSVNTGPTTLGLKKYNTSYNSTTGILVITN
jgi:hypothetical protein